MIELSQHLEALLLENDCVILPDFGGFITYYSPSRWIDEEELFLPPIRTIGFNPQLTMNDGLLAQSYMKIYNVNFATASKIIEDEIEQLKSLILEKGNISLPSIGELSLGIGNSYKFQPTEDGVIAPILYGLSSFSISQLKAAEIFKAKEVIPVQHIETPTIDKPKKPTERKINYPIIRYTATIAAAIVLLFLMSTPIENTYVEKENLAQLFSYNTNKKNTLSSFMTQSSETQVVKKEDKEVVKPTIKEEVKTPEIASKNNNETINNKTHIEETVKIPRELKQEKNKQTNNQAVATISQPAKPIIEKKINTENNKRKYNIIVASIVNIADAPPIINNLKKQGYDATVVEGNGRIRISIKSFNNKNEATGELLEIRKIKQFKDAWLLSGK